jgi:hypothetical protein
MNIKEYEIKLQILEKTLEGQQQQIKKFKISRNFKNYTQIMLICYWLATGKKSRICLQMTLWLFCIDVVVSRGSQRLSKYLKK